MSKPTLLVDGKEVPASKKFIEQAMDRCRKLIDKGFQVEHYTRLLHEYQSALRSLHKPARSKRRRETRDRYADAIRVRRRLNRGWEERHGLDESTDLPLDDEYYIMAEEERPRIRADCRHAYRPCPFIGCKHNLWMDVRHQSQRAGYIPSVKPNYPDTPPWEMPPGRSCALDIAEAGGLTLEEVGELISLTRERVRQIEVIALEKLLDVIDPDLREDMLSLDNDTTWGIMQDERH